MAGEAQVPGRVGGYENGGSLFNGACKQLKGPLKAKEQQGRLFATRGEFLLL